MMDQIGPKTVSRAVPTTTLAALAFLISCLLSSCAPNPAHTSVPVPAATPTATTETMPTQTSVPVVPDYRAGAWVSTCGVTGQYGSLVIYGRLTRGNDGIAGAQMYSIVHYNGISQRLPDEGFRTTASDGIASITLHPEGQAPVSYLEAEVHLIYEGQTFDDVALYTPDG